MSDAGDASPRQSATLPIHPVAWQGFGADPARYDRGRPDYPGEAIDAIVDAARMRPGTITLDLAAGTGKLTRQLADRGCDRLVAIEPVVEMAQFLSKHTPVARGVAERLPVASSSIHLLTIAQAFHWFESSTTWSELARVVRPGGLVAIIWNARDRSVPWVDAVWSIMDRVEKNAPWRNHDERKRLEAPADFSAEEPLTFPHRTPVTPDDIVERIRSVSHVAVLPTHQQTGIESEIRDVLADHPQTAGRSQLELVYRTDLFLFTRR